MLEPTAIRRRSRLKKFLDRNQRMAAFSGSFHTHSSYCDGDGSLEDVVEAGVGRGISDLGFSSHAPLPFQTDWNMPLEKLSSYVAEARDLRARFTGRIDLWLGAELDYIPGPEVARFQESEIFTAGFDYFVGSVHFLTDRYPPRSFDATEDEFNRILVESYRGDIRSMTSDYYSRVARLPSLPKVCIAGHFDVIKRWNAGKTYFREDEGWYQEQVNGALHAIAGSGLLVELNTAGWRKGLGEPYPAPWILERCRDIGIGVTVSADSHKPEDVDYGFDCAVELLNSLGIEPVNPASVLR